MSRALPKVPPWFATGGAIAREAPEKNLKLVMKDGKIYKNTL